MLFDVSVSALLGVPSFKMSASIPEKHDNEAPLVVVVCWLLWELPHGGPSPCPTSPLTQGRNSVLMIWVSLLLLLVLSLALVR